MVLFDIQTHIEYRFGTTLISQRFYLFLKYYQPSVLCSLNFELRLKPPLSVLAHI